MRLAADLDAVADVLLAEVADGRVADHGGQRLATHVVGETLALLRSSGAAIARAAAEVANLPARRVLEGAGMAEVSRTADAVVYEIRL